ncbi:hypothetical protein BH11ACT8_BH11ACT8_27270 [soil metagenome]
MAVAVVLLAACGAEGGGESVSAAGTSETTTPTQPPTADGTSTGTPSTGTPSTGTPSTGTPSTGTPSTGTQDDDPSEGAPAFPTSTASQIRKSPGGSVLVLTDVRVVAHEGFDRIVLEFSGQGTPGWYVNYVDEAVLDGSGEAVPLGGDAVLDIYASGTTWPAPDYYGGPPRIDSAGGDVAGLYVGGTFEGTTQVLAGVDGDRVPFRVFALTGPSRLVVDVSDASAG